MFEEDLNILEKIWKGLERFEKIRKILKGSKNGFSRYGSGISTKPATWWNKHFENYIFDYSISIESSRCYIDANK